MKTVGGFGSTHTTGLRYRPALIRRAGMIVAVVTLMILPGCSTEETPAPTSHATSAEDALNRESACLRDKGWEVTITDDGGLSLSVPEEQMELYRKDTAECSEGLLPDRAKFTDEQWAEMYTAVMESADCLAKEGYEAPDRPSLQTFVDMNGDWSPYSEIDTYDFTRLENLCPQAEYWG